MSEVDLPDVNVLVALLNPAHVHHDAAREWFTTTSRFATTPLTESGLVRMAMNPIVMGQAHGAAAALEVLRSLRADERAEFLPDDSSLATAMIDLVCLVGFRQVTDLHLVNLAAYHNARLITFDRKVRAVLASDDQGLICKLG